MDKFSFLKVVGFHIGNKFWDDFGMILSPYREHKNSIGSASNHLWDTDMYNNY